MKITKYFCKLLLSLIITQNVFAQTNWGIDPTFNPTDTGFDIGHSFNGRVVVSLLQPDGKIIIGGLFTSYNGVARNFITRLNADGSLDDLFDPGTGANGSVSTIAIQSDSKIIIGGSFTSFNGTTCSNIARLNADGTLDTSFNLGTGANNNVLAIAIQPDGKIIIGGSFTSFNSTERNRIARLNADGTLDTSFNPGIEANNQIRTIALQSDGKIIIGGSFTSFNSTERNRIARLNTDGTLDTSFNPGAGANSFVNKTALQSDGKIIIGGDFTSYNGTVCNYIGRLNVDGTLDISYNPGTGTNWNVLTISIQPNGKIIIGGNFTSFNGTSRNHIARLNTDGSLDISFNPGMGANFLTHSTAIQSDGKILLGGDFTSYNGTARNRIARLNENGSLDTGFAPLTGMGASNPIWTTSIQPDGKIILGGDFTSCNGTESNHIARLNTDGTLDTSFNAGTGANNRVRAIALQPDGRIIIGGSFTSYNGIVRNRIARLNANGTLDVSFNSGTGVIGDIATITLQPDGKIIIGGNFISYNDTPINDIARLNADGTLDTSFNPGTGTNGAAVTISLQSDGKIIIAGGFTSYNGTARNNIARLNADGTLDNLFNPGTGANANVLTSAIQPDGKIIIGGGFASYNGTARNYIARLNANGSLDTSFNPGTQADSDGIFTSIFTTTLQTDGKIISGGSFPTNNGTTTRNYIARFNADGALDTSFNPGTGADGIVLTIAIQPDGKIIIGGDFTSFNGIGRNRIARVEFMNVPTIEIKTDGTGRPSGSNVQFAKTGVGIDQLKELEITNTGNGTLIVTDVQVTGDFTLASALPPPIDPGNTELLSIRFSPTGLGERNGTLTILSNGDIPVFTLTLVGEGDAEPEVYNVLTPRINGKHDFLNIRNITLFPNNIVSIYDRWGNKVFEKSDYDNVNGTFIGISDDGKELPEGTYYYVLDKNNGSKRITGFILLKR
jgi:uncharacterized delta-60 repeat protein/gliding motility-associated-like protein